ncbi:hypothetical protein HYU13_03505 [Candidatus Woesearchaeota archaeon]|nr:hypothetical protein [Candidatus Woesearchaeota archaeon]
MPMKIDEFIALGVPGINAEIASRVAIIKSTKSGDSRLATAVGELNTLLYSLIQYHAPNVNAVTIVGTVPSSSPDWDLFPQSGGYRDKLKSYASKIGMVARPDESLHFRFMAHLPFSRESSTHGSGDRTAMASAFHNVWFVEPDPVMISRGAPASLCFFLARGGFRSSHFAYLLAPEIETVSVGLINDDQYSPLLMESMRQGIEIAPSALRHYVRYKEFQVTPASPGGIEMLTFQEEVNYSLRGAIISGFAFLPDFEGKECLMEFQKCCVGDPVSLSTTSPSGAFAAYAREFIHRYSLDALTSGVSAVSSYQGTDAISRLHQQTKEIF